MSNLKHLNNILCDLRNQKRYIINKIKDIRSHKKELKMNLGTTLPTQTIETNIELKNAVKNWFDQDPNIKQKVITKYGDITGWVFDKNVTDMSYLFAGQTKFNEDISNWNTKDVTNMEGMFAGATSFNRDLSKWSVDLVTNCTTFNLGSKNWQPIPITITITQVPIPIFTKCTI